MTSAMFTIISQISTAPLPKVDDSTTVTVLLQLTFGIAGALTVLFLVWGGFKYVTSQGEPDRIAKAKDTILYSVIGLVVTIASYGIVAYVTRWL